MLSRVRVRVRLWLRVAFAKAKDQLKLLNIQEKVEIFEADESKRKAETSPELS